MSSPTLADAASRMTAMADKPKKRKKWIQGATENAHGQFRHKAEAAGKSTRQYAEEHKDDSGKTGKQARLALTLMGMNGGEKKKTRREKLYDRKKD